MALYDIVLFAHIVAAIALVGGSSFTHVVFARAMRARTSEGLRGLLEVVVVTSRALMFIAIVVVVAGIYLTVDGGWWAQGWVVVSLVMFLGAGAIAGAVLDPASQKALAAVEEQPDGPIAPGYLGSLLDAKVGFMAWIMSGTDVAIVFLMTVKPAGYATSLAVALVAWAIAAGIAMREARHARTAAAGVPAT